LLATATVPYTTSWSTVTFPVDFTGYDGDALLFGAFQTLTSDDTIDIGYLDFSPTINNLQLYPSGTGGGQYGCKSSAILSIHNNGFDCGPIGYGAVVSAAPVTGGGQGSGDTTLNYSSPPGALPGLGCFFLDSEVECYTGNTGSVLTGITRGVYGTTAAAHSVGTSLTGYNAVLGSPNQVPGIVYVGNVADGEAVLGINTAIPQGHSGTAALDINSGAGEIYVGKDGSIVQGNASAANELQGSLAVGRAAAGAANSQIITNSTTVLKADQPNAVLEPYSFGGGLVGPLNVVAPSTIAAPSLFLSTTQSGNYGYECTGVDSVGNTIGGTTVSVTNGPNTLAIGGGYIVVTCPIEPGAVTMNIWRTTGGSTQGLIGTGTTQPVYTTDFGGPATSGSPPGTTSTPQVCIGSSCWQTGSSAPSGSCNTGNLYTNRSGSPDTLYVCKAGAWAGVL
jgi:hypothetical protein